MNRLLNHYCLSVEFANVSGAEHLEMLQIRDQLADLEITLTEDEKKSLSQADRQLIRQADKFYSELSHFVDLKKKRESEKIEPLRWWWYLDVLAYIPKSLFATNQSIIV